MADHPNFINGSALNASFNSKPISLDGTALYGINMQFGGSPCSFSAALYASCDPLAVPTGASKNGSAASYQPNPSPGNFEPIPGGSATLTSSGGFTFNVSTAAYNFVYLAITDNSSGSNTGVLYASFCSKLGID